MRRGTRTDLWETSHIYGATKGKEPNGEEITKPKADSVPETRKREQMHKKWSSGAKYGRKFK